MPDDHYVSQFYLRNFQIPTRANHVFSYQRGRKPIPKAIRSVARVRDFERLSREASGLKHDSISKRLNEIEDNCAPIIRQLVDSEKLHLTPPEWDVLCLFISYLISRGPTGRQEQINLFQSINIIQAKVMAENKEAFHESMKDSNRTDQEIEEIRLKTLDFEKHYRIETESGFLKDYSLVMSLLAGELGSQRLAQKHPVLIKTNSGKEFITSDNPVVFDADKDRYQRGSGLGIENSLIYLPISPKRALLLVNRVPNKNVVTVDGDQVDSSNAQVMLYARDSVFSQSYNPKIAEAFDKTEPRRKETIVVESANEVILKVSGNELEE